eukprot:6186687-Pleurochrysis_carterae.AAC.1
MLEGRQQHDLLLRFVTLLLAEARHVNQLDHVLLPWVGLGVHEHGRPEGALAYNLHGAVPVHPAAVRVACEPARDFRPVGPRRLCVTEHHSRRLRESANHR